MSVPRLATACPSPLCLVLLNQLDVVCIDLGQQIIAVVWIYLVPGVAVPKALQVHTLEGAAMAGVDGVPHEAELCLVQVLQVLGGEL